MRLLIAGGETDPNLAHLLAAARGAGVRTTRIVFGPREHPIIHWDLPAGVLKHGGKALEVSAAFIRYDVFNSMADPREAVAFRAHAWYAAIAGWLESRRDIKVLNRDGEANVLKAAVLRQAIALGVDIPRTYVSNDTRLLKGLIRGDGTDWIAKPVCGGEYTQIYGDVMEGREVRGGAAAAPALVQERLVSPDVRVFRVGRHFFGFTIATDMIDYRADTGCKVEALKALPARLVAQLQSLTDALGLDFAAADYKASAATGDLKFLEVNTAPMFVAFDIAGGGCLTRAMLETLATRA